VANLGVDGIPSWCHMRDRICHYLFQYGDIIQPESLDGYY
jgi:hypothetical protein